ncbi:hypothetical protein ACFQI7_23155 [Paenibacillus allorhizosphaerae]|uniref:Uncharacterized protein n=1 Tax=Paenibacillus allorhizosphaerae TaxID=2849866 RepID=A0ABM8VR53_9BACL|nr:hypothetical protein [Paenibacillus allorhizosphaerae]CAG7654891.1 hypothetical protein PAECIP111802_05927 [Paenibacillus allorhizosphaerae]
MSKLTDNLRWESSRMMLPQHKEALIERQNPPSETVRAQVPTREELEMIRDSVLLPIMLTMVEKNGKDMQLSTSSIRKLYVAATQVLMDRIHFELAAINKELRAKKIKVFKDDQEDTDLHYKYICRGYENKFAIMRDVARANISVKLGEHIQRMIEDMKARER